MRIYRVSFLLLFLLLLLFGCIRQETVEEAARNLNQIKLELKVDNFESISLYPLSIDSANPQRIGEFNVTKECFFGGCYYLMCGFRKDFLKENNPFKYIFGVNLTDGRCFVYSIGESLDDEEAFVEDYTSYYDNDKKDVEGRFNVAYLIEEVGYSQGNNFYDASRASPLCLNQLRFPIQLVRGDYRNGYYLTPLLSNSIRCATERNSIPVFILSNPTREGNGVVPLKNNVEEILNILSSSNSPFIIFTEVNPLYSNEEGLKQISQRNLEKISEQIRVMKRYCNYVRDGKLYRAASRCIVGISLPFYENLSLTTEFFDSLVRTYGVLHNNEFTGLFDGPTIVGFYLVSNESKLCNGYSLISDALIISNYFRTYKPTNEDEVHSLPIFLQGVSIIRDGNQGCEFNQLNEKQLFYSFFGDPNVISGSGIINIPSKPFYPSYSVIPGEESWYIGENIRDVNTFNYFFSFCQGYYKYLNYPKIAYRAGYGGETCPLGDKVVVSYSFEQFISNFSEVDPLFEVNPDEYPQLYSCAPCFSYEDPESYLGDVSEISGDMGLCRGNEEVEISSISSSFGTDPELTRAVLSSIEFDYSPQGKCNVKFVRESLATNPLSLEEVNNYLREAGCREVEEMVFDPNTETCVPSSLNPSLQERCVPIGVGYALIPKDVLDRYGLACGSNPLSYYSNLCIVSAALGDSIKNAQSRSSSLKEWIYESALEFYDIWFSNQPVDPNSPNPQSPREEFAEEVLGKYKFYALNCGSCYSPSFYENTCNLAQQITNADICGGESPKRDVHLYVFENYIQAGLSEDKIRETLREIFEERNKP